MQEYPLVEFSDFERQRLSEFTQACKEHNVNFIEFYIEIDSEQEFYDLLMPIIDLLEDSSLSLEVSEEEVEYLAELKYRNDSVVVGSGDRGYPHIIAMLEEINTFLGETGIDKRLYWWPILEEGTIIFAQNPRKLLSFQKSGGYDPSCLNPDLLKISLDNFRGVKTRIYFDDANAFMQLNASFIRSVNSLQREMDREIFPAGRIGLFKRSPTGQVLLIINDQQVGHFSLDDEGGYTFVSGYTLLALRDVLRNHIVFRVKHIDLRGQKEIVMKREVLLESIQAAIEDAIR